MTFDEITEKLWAVRYDDQDDNELDRLFNDWNDVQNLREFFKQNIEDLGAYFKITDINQAIDDTIEDAERLQAIFMDIPVQTDLSTIFRPLDNSQIGTPTLAKEKARPKRNQHASWLRIYAIRLNDGFYIITGGAIKLTLTMEEREHTKNELSKIERVRCFLINEGIVDVDGFRDYLTEL